MIRPTFRTVYHLEPLPQNRDPVIYFAGPTWHPPGEPLWQDHGVDYLRQRKFRGTVCLPLPWTGDWVGDEVAQIKWQLHCQETADFIVFWMFRPGLVTMSEFGQWYRSGKLAVGVPPGTEKLEYVRQVIGLYDIPTADTLEATLDITLDRLS